jgi:hypothetical protein
MAARGGDERQLAFAEGLSKAERALIVVRDELYGGSWDELVLDLEARRERRPVIFKLNARLEEDLQRIDKLRAFERATGVDLRVLLAAVEGAGKG